MSETINAEIIAIGSELLLGQIANTNAQWMSEQLALHGINTFFHTVVGDNLERITKIMKQAAERSNVIIISGGLGPTEDDMSREAFQQISLLPIVEEQTSLKKIAQFYNNQQIVMTPNNRRQARVFKDSLVLENKVGMAPGNIVTYKGVHWIFLPGVPREMKQIFTDDVLPFLKKINGEMIIQSLVLKFIGIGESSLEHRLRKIIDKQQNPTIAPLAQKDGVTIRLTAKAKTGTDAKGMLEVTKSEILKEVGEYYYGENNDTLEAKLIELLKQKDKHLAAAESLTGGAFQDKLVATPGVSTVFQGGIVSYASSVKQNVLSVSAKTIANKGTVSAACALEMAKNVSELMNAELGISFTGIAGPEETEGKKVGTVFIALYDHDDDYEYVEECSFPGDRRQIRHRSVLKGFEILLNYLK